MACLKTAGTHPDVLAKDRKGTVGSLVNIVGEKLRQAILSIKYFRKCSHNIVDGTMLSKSQGFNKRVKNIQKSEIQI